MGKKKKPAGKVSHRGQGGEGKFTDAFVAFASGSTATHGPIATQGKYRVSVQSDPVKLPKGIGKSAAKDPEARQFVKEQRQRGGSSVTSKSYSKAKGNK